jgi:DNA-directed RNA polymerase sigma subunit (sigma70/sigma32)
MIRVPYPLANLAMKVDVLVQKNRRQISAKEAASMLDEAPHRVEQAMSLHQFNSTVSLDQVLSNSEGGEMTLLDTITDGHAPELNDDYHWFHNQLGTLSPVEFEVLNLRYATERRSSLMQLAQNMGKSKHQIQAIERRALAKLRSSLTPVLNP